MKIFTVLLILTISTAQPLIPQLSAAQKLIVTVTNDWNSNKGTVYLFDRSKDTWKRQHGQFSVSIGENGLAWGTGVHPAQQGEYIKSEGDRRSPAGIFELDTILYGMNTTAPEGVRFPYRQMTPMTRCIDDTASQFYNSIVEEGTVPKDWESAEEMNDVDPDYKFVLTVRNNAGQKKGKGSCIFYHINNIPTSGCTSMDEEDMLTLLHWLDPKRKTYIIQLPHEEYHKLRLQWGLPKLTNN